MIRTMLCYLALLLSSTLAIAQQQDGLGITLSYFGENAIHPGLKAGISYPLLEKVKVKPRRSSKRQEKHGAITKRKQLVVGANTGFYNHPNNHSAFLLGGTLAFQRIKEAKGKGKLRGVELGAGYLQRIYNIDTYQANEEGIYELTNGGQAQFFTSLAVYFGRDLSVKGGSPISWNIKPTLFLLTPYSHSVTLNAALELGITYKL